MHSHRKVLWRRVSSIILYREYETYGRKILIPNCQNYFLWKENSNHSRSILRSLLQVCSQSLWRYEVEYIHYDINRILGAASFRLELWVAPSPVRITPLGVYQHIWKCQTGKKKFSLRDLNTWCEKNLTERWWQRKKGRILTLSMQYTQATPSKAIAFHLHIFMWYIFNGLLQ